MLIPVPPEIWAQSYYVDLGTPIRVRCPQCWSEIFLATRRDAALFLHRSANCRACDVPLEKSEYWPMPLSRKEADKQYQQLEG